MKIEKVLNLADGEHRFQFEVMPAEMGLDLKDFEGHAIFDNPVRVQAVLNKTGHTYYLKFSVSTEIRLVCDRCLNDVRLPVEGPFETVYTDAKSRDEFGDDTEIRFIDARHANEIVLDKDVKDTLFLAMPTKILCQEDCKGLCAECGANLNETTCEHVRVTEKI